ncbi:MAG: hypothetical protein IPH88_05830 [Bacteroidales bacterium]|nr:hypothetical protein [Bacteroidales bacterium]
MTSVNHLPTASLVTSGTFIGISSTANGANIFMDDAVTYNSIPAIIGTAYYYNGANSDITNINNWWSNSDGATGSHQFDWE